MRRVTPTTLLIMLCALLLAACGGAEAPPVTPPAATPTPNTDPRALGVNNTTPTQGTGSTQQPPLPDGDADDLEGGLDGGSPEGNIFEPQAIFESDVSSTGGFDDSAYGTGFGETGIEAPETTTETTTPETTTYGPATVSVNGKNYTTSKNSIFPSDTQLFQVVAIRAGAVDFELVAGEFGSGATGFTLKVGQTQKLVNDDEGITYTLKLVRIDSNTSGGSTPSGLWRI